MLVGGDSRNFRADMILALKIGQQFWFNIRQQRIGITHTRNSVLFGFWRALRQKSFRVHSVALNFRGDRMCM